MVIHNFVYFIFIVINGFSVVLLQGCRFITGKLQSADWLCTFILFDFIRTSKRIFLLQF